MAAFNSAIDLTGGLPSEDDFDRTGITTSLSPVTGSTLTNSKLETLSRGVWLASLEAYDIILRIEPSTLLIMSSNWYKVKLDNSEPEYFAILGFIYSNTTVANGNSRL
jgi:hypothetical protein